MPKLAEDAQTEHAKKQLEIERTATEKTRSEYARFSKGRPTPTQEENDLAMLGAHILEHDPDGSDPDPHQDTEHKNLEAGRSTGKPANYQTRQQHAPKE